MEQVLHQLPDGWQWETMGSVSKVVGGGTPKSTVEEFFFEGNIPWITPADLSGYTDKYISSGARFITELGLNNSSAKLLPKNAVLFTSRAPIGYVAIAKNEIATNQGFKSFIVEPEKAIPEYVYFWLKANKDLAESYANGATFLELSGAKAKLLPIPIAPISEQKHIVEKLDALLTRIDTAIEHLQSKLDLSKQLFESLLDEFFKLSGCDSVPLTEVVDFIGGSQPPKSQFSDIQKDGYVRLIQIRDYKSDNHIVYVDSASTKKFCTKDDVMIGRYGPPVFQILRGLDGAYNVALMKAVPDEDILTKDYLYWFLQSPSIRNYVIGISQRAAGQSGVNKKALEKYLIPIPSKGIQDSIVERVEKLVSKSRDLEIEVAAEIEFLSKLKASSLDSAFKGEL